MKEYLIEGLIYDHDVGISVLVFEVLGYVERVVEGQPAREDHLNDDYDDYDDDVSRHFVFCSQGELSGHTKTPHSITASLRRKSGSRRNFIVSHQNIEVKTIQVREVDR